MKRWRWYSCILAVAVLVSACVTEPAMVPETMPAPAAAPAAPAHKPIELTILHVNDTHSKLEPISTALRLDINEALKGKPVYVELGGFPRLWSAVEAIRKENSNVLFLHAGDAFQGTLYFTQFGGKADVDFLNAVRIDAMALGNHEFDKGPALLRSSLLSGAAFDVLGANIAYADDPELAGANILPYTVKTISGENVGIIGLTITDTPFISSPGKYITFSDPLAKVTSTVAELERQGINKIIVLSHLGYDAELALARSAKGVDIIVGGHSHTLLGTTAVFGLASRGEYPSVVKNGADTVLVVQGWEWAKVLGTLKVEFDAAGRIASWIGTPKLLVGDSWMRIYDLPGADGKLVRVEFRKTPSGWQAREYDGRAYAIEPPPERTSAHLAVLASLAAKFAGDPRIMVVADHPEGARKLASYAAGVNALKAKVACEASEELARGNNTGPGPIIADAMLWKTGADIAIMNPGGVRTNLNPGQVSVAQVYELQPFGNTLVTLSLAGSDVLKVFEDMCDYTVTSYTDKTAATALIYVAGATFTLDIKAAKGSRVKDARVGKQGAYAPLDPSKSYMLVVNSFMASGGDKNDTLKTLAARQYDTGFIDSEATLEYLQGKTLQNASEIRVSQQF
jgi:5'-nucleotidase